MRKTLFLFLLLASPTLAQHHSIPNRLGRLAGRTLVNMATAKDKEAFAAQWGVGLAMFGDYYESRQNLHWCVGCQEANPLYGPRPSGQRFIAIGVPIGFGFAMMAQGLHEVSIKDNNWWVRHVAWTIPSLIVAGAETYEFKANYDHAEVWKKCRNTPGCFPRPEK